MLYNKNVARNLWGEAVNTTCHTVNRVYFRPGIKKTPYELWKGRIGRMWESLTSEVMKEYFWVIPLQVRLIEYTTKEP